MSILLKLNNINLKYQTGKDNITILKDIKLTGSLANFNWSKFSDVDLHLVIDFSQITDNEKFAKDYFDAKKFEFA